MVKTRDDKQAYFEKLLSLMQEYPTIFIVEVT